MSRNKHETAIETGPDVFDQEITDRRAAEASAVVGQVAASTEPPPGQPATNGHAQETLKKKYTPPADPFGFENRAGRGNRVHLLTSQDKGVWVIRFEKNPNELESHSKENPHPVIKLLKDEGYRWGFDIDGKGGWGKAFNGDAYGQDHIEARKVLLKAAEMIGAKIEQGTQVG